VGDADSMDWVDLADAAVLFARVGLPAPGRAPLMPLDHQVARKLHALTGPGNRARDLVDLQLVAANAELDLVAKRRVRERLFAYRKAQTWPPEVVLRDGWEGLYAEQASGLPVLQNLADAVEWANGFIRLIAVAG